jgi:hypothetical protein
VPPALAVTRELAILGALAYVLRDDVPLPGRTCDDHGPRDYAAGVADGFARALFKRLSYGPDADRKPEPDNPLDEPERTRLDHIIEAVGLGWGIIGVGVVAGAVLTHKPDLYAYILGSLGVPGVLGWTRGQADLAESLSQDREDAAAAAAELARATERTATPTV